ncbi:MAG: hypothetical protein G01um101416_800 [Microgenomates group bacterium Gr01-1014_16]|nr:MAG: hypothetical protein G01um101416_800 [Microgenomates group bacterium Gr01-1014_16]
MRYNIIEEMKCPICGQEMKVERKDVSSDSRNGKKYDRTVFHCEKCDTWGNIEVPKDAS